MRPGLTLFVDADDTLWENNVYFDSVIGRTAERLTTYGVPEVRTREALLAIERQRTRAHGYGSINFGASLEVLCDHVGVGASMDELRPFLRAEIAALRRKRLEILPDVPETLAYLRRRHRLVLFTKGNHDEQWDKVQRSGLRDLFHQVDVVREKDTACYDDAARRLGVRPDRAWMIGNSPKSDILPARAAGLGAVFVPHPGTWELELADLPDDSDLGTVRVARFAELVNIF
ncbi:MAG TPA: HAD family hydrolase [Luteitalea sp.]|nr:HAD family hydrolase [Luteitalea sp.]